MEGITVIAVVAIGIMIALMAVEYNKNKSAPVLTVPAKLIRKKIRMDEDSTNYLLIFETEKHIELTFSVKRQIYKSYSEGDFGDLTYQRHWFHDFDPLVRSVK